MELIINTRGITQLLQCFDGIAWRYVTCLSKTGKEMHLFITLILQNTRIYQTWYWISSYNSILISNFVKIGQAIHNMKREQKTGIKFISKS